MALETETTRSVGTFKTLKRDLESMKIMGELCGSLVYYASRYVNENLDRYTPIKELEFQERRKNCSSAEHQYIDKLAENMVSAGECETCADKKCNGKPDGCNKGVVRFIMKEVNKHCSLHRYDGDKRNPYFNSLDARYNAAKDNFDEYVSIIMTNFPALSIYEAIGLVYVWLCTRKQDFKFDIGEG